MLMLSDPSDQCRLLLVLAAVIHLGRDGLICKQLGSLEGFRLELFA